MEFILLFMYVCTVMRKCVPPHNKILFRTSNFLRHGRSPWDYSCYHDQPPNILAVPRISMVVFYIPFAASFLLLDIKI